MTENFSLKFLKIVGFYCVPLFFLVFVCFNTIFSCSCNDLLHFCLSSPIVLGELPLPELLQSHAQESNKPLVHSEIALEAKKILQGEQDPSLVQHLQYYLTKINTNYL